MAKIFTHLQDAILQESDIGQDQYSLSFALDEDGCNWLAQCYKIVDIDSVKAWVNLSKAKHQINAHGKFEADIVQTCVSSLLPIEQHIEGEFSRIFIDEARWLKIHQNEQEYIIDQTNDDFDLIHNGVIDIGQVILEEVSLGMELYPRHKDAPDFPHESTEKVQETYKPFATLSVLKGE